ncbi:MAG: 50S ribosomal protein L14e [Candidatus Aenigmarchaeota archaeon]|nr:50S ribosomal protein L14e [Candidatus Aenigmarchaeota archaeon]
MATLTVGRIAMKIAGREAGKYCTVLTAPKDNFVQVTGPKVLTGVKRRRCNIEHLEPTKYKIDIKKEDSDNVVMKALEKEGLVKKLGLKKPSPEIVKEAEKSKKSKKTKKKDEKEEPKKKKVKKEAKKKSSKTKKKTAKKKK